ncbi:MAG: hypothetical protein MUE36_13975 [Acidimicrobiales bacterium]|jgi:hypothetical protein|nr:hypothetical protein [Acidimicrobiales bacterium]
MFTTDASACTTGAAPAVVVPATGSAVLTTTVIAASWYRHIDGFGFPVNHKRLTRRPVIPVS